MNRLLQRILLIVILSTFLLPLCCTSKSPKGKSVLVGAERMDQYLDLLKGKKVGLVVNHTSLVGTSYKETHLVDSLLSLKVNVEKIFTPEHGFRGTADAGEKIKSGKDAKTGLPIISLYGSKRKPAPEDIQGLDLILFDIQDVGARFYTYISTMTLVMEACAENNISFIVLDRPNPNGFYVDGPVLESEFKSFVGMHPVPIVHGMTVGEYAQMVNGQGWLAEGIQCDLRVVPCLYYDHNVLYKVRHKPSPNLPNMTSIYLYPSLCLFEGTTVSVGRGTDKPFQMFGHPDYSNTGFSFTPHKTEGAKNPKHKGETCYGTDLSYLRKEYFLQQKKLNLTWLIEFYQKFPDKENFFTPYFEKLAGTDKLRSQIVSGMTESQIRESWQPALEKFLTMRKKYLLYKDFN